MIPFNVKKINCVVQEVLCVYPESAGRGHKKINKIKKKVVTTPTTRPSGGRNAIPVENKSARSLQPASCSLIRKGSLFDIRGGFLILAHFVALIFPIIGPSKCTQKQFIWGWISHMGPPRLHLQPTWTDTYGAWSQWTDFCWVWRVPAGCLRGLASRF